MPEALGLKRRAAAIASEMSMPKPEETMIPSEESTDDGKEHRLRLVKEGAFRADDPEVQRNRADHGEEDRRSLDEDHEKRLIRVHTGVSR